MPRDHKWTRAGKGQGAGLQRSAQGPGRRAQKHRDRAGPAYSKGAEKDGAGLRMGGRGVGKATGWDLGDLGSVPSAMLLRQLEESLLTTACFLVGVTYLLLVEGKHL